MLTKFQLPRCKENTPAIRLMIPIRLLHFALVPRAVAPLTPRDEHPVRVVVVVDWLAELHEFGVLFYLFQDDLCVFGSLSF